MPGQVKAQHREAMVGEITGLKRPDRAILAGAVNENHRRLGRIELTATRCSEDSFAVDRNVHIDLLLRGPQGPLEVGQQVLDRLDPNG